MSCEAVHSWSVGSFSTAGRELRMSERRLSRQSLWREESPPKGGLLAVGIIVSVFTDMMSGL